MHNAGELEWGLRDSDIEGTALWGARVLIEYGRFGKQTFATLWDRQGAVGTEEDRKALQAALNNGAIIALFNHFERDLEDDKEDHFLVTHGVKFWYSTRQSCGYVYVTGILA
jgi:hypothetical protein